MVAMSGSGAFRGFPATTGDRTVKSSGRGDCKARVNNNLDVTISGSGNVYYKMNQPFEQSFRCFPNPARDQIYLSFRTADSNANISITDRIGKKIFSGTIHGSSTVTIDLPGNPAGIYFLKLDIDRVVIYKKFML